MTVEIGLLGTVEVRLDGRALDIGHARQRCVLAVLALEANRPVPVERLIDRVWADPPQRALITVQSYLSRLRKALAPAAGVSISHRAGGYQLSTDPDRVDVHAFRRLVAAARTAGTDAERDGLLGRALDLWRGPPLAALEAPWLDTVRHGLDNERLAAELDRTDSALRLGRHADLLAGLAAARAERPLDERVAGQAMLALYRCGRQADALEAYQRLRLRLADEVGTDPGPPLQRLYHQILTADAALAAPAPAGAVPPAAAAVPRQLPAAPARFAGRAGDLAALTTIVEAEPAPVVTISGGGGVGKTWLALAWADRHAGRYPDGQLYVNLRGYDPTGDPLEPTVALRGFLAALGVEPHRIPAEPDAQASLYRSLIAGRRMLVVLDNARDTGTVTPLLPGAAGCTVLITSRNRLTALVVGHGARPVCLDVLPTAEARTLLAGHLGRHPGTGDGPAVDALLAHCAGLPLALGIAAARAVLRPELPLSAIAEELRATATRLDALDAGELTANLRAVLACSVRALDPPAARLFALLGHARGPDLGTAAAASLAGLPVAAVRALLDQLVAANLVQQHAPGRYRMHDLVRLYAVDLGGQEPAGAGPAVRRLLDHYLHTAHRAALLLSPHRDPLPVGEPLAGTTGAGLADLDAAMAWFGTEHLVLLAEIRRAYEDGYDRYAVQLPWTLATYFDRRGHWDDWIAVQRTAVAAAQRSGDRRAQAQARRLLANGYSNQRRFDQAHAELQSTLDLLDGTDHAGRAHVEFDIALLHDRQGQPDQALPYAQRSLAGYRAAANELGEAVALNAIGWYHCQLGQYRESIGYCRRALALAERTGSAYGQANTWDSIGYAHHHLGEYGPAGQAYRRAVDLFRGIGDRHSEALVLEHIGDTLDADGDPAGARDRWREASRILDDLAAPEAAGLRRKLAAVPRPRRTVPAPG